MTRSAWLIAGALLTACSEDPPPQPVAKAPVPVVAPVAATPPPAQVQQEADAVAKTLLGLNAKPRVAQPPQKRSPPRSPRLAKPEEEDMSAFPIEEPGLSDADFQQAIDDWDGFKNCLALAAYRNGRENEKGALKVEFEIHQTGAVSRSRVMESTSPVLSECIQSRSKNLRFPAFAGYVRVTKEAKFIF